jgi:hypothetical protein
MAIVGLGFACWFGLNNIREPSPMIGQILFTALASLLYFFAGTAGFWATADCLSEEKREGTLGLLFLTDLKGYDVVLGKLTATSLTAFYGLLAVFPILAIPLLMGGVTAGEFWRVALASVNLLFLSLSIGLVTSAFCHDERKAAAITIFLFALLSAGPPLLGLYFERTDPARVFHSVFLSASPVYACVTAFESSFTSKGDAFWVTVMVTQIYAWFCLFLACQKVPRAWQDKPSTAASSWRRENWRRFTEGAADKRLALRRKLLEINPFLWLTGSSHLKGVAVWSVLIVGAIICVWIDVATETKLSEPENAFYLFGAQVILKAWFASEGSRRFAVDRRSGALELILSTPLSVEEIVRGQRLALVRQFWGPVAAVLSLDVLLMFAAMPQHNGEEREQWVMLFVYLIGFFLFDLVALSWVSLWIGLSSRKANRAAGGAIARIMILPGVVILLGGTCFGLAGVLMKFDAWWIPVMLVFVVCSVNNLAFMVHAKDNLLKHFREIATQRNEVRLPVSIMEPTLPPVLPQGNS